MSNELRAAATWIISADEMRLGLSVDNGERVVIESSVVRSGLLLARHYLASAGREDGGEAVTEEWLRLTGLLIEDDDEDSLGLPFSPGRCAECHFGVVRYCEYWQAILSEGDTPDQIYLGDMKTRGDVYKLLTGLGIELRETT